MKLNQLPEVSICDIKSARSFIECSNKKIHLIHPSFCPRILLRSLDWKIINQRSFLGSRIFSVLFRKRNGDIRRMPPLLLRKITRKSTAVSVVFAFVFYWLIIEISLYKLFHTLGIFISWRTVLQAKKKTNSKLPKPCNRRGFRLRFTPGD